MRSALVLLLLLAVACSDQSIVAPEAYGRIPCRPPATLVAMVTGRPFTPAAMHSALIHVAHPMASVFAASAERQALQDAILRVAADIKASNHDGACRLLAIADGVLAGLPETPATLPDRDGIRWILALTAQSLAAAMPQ